MSNKLTLYKDYRKLYKKYKYKYLDLKNMIGGAYVLGQTLSKDMARKIGSYNTNVKVFAGANHTMIMKTDGFNETVNVFACGDNYHGQLGLGNNDDTNTLTPICSCFAVVPKGVVIKQVVAGGDHTMIIAQNNMVFACGNNSHGQLGLGDTTDRNIFTHFRDRRDRFIAVPALPEGKVASQVVAGGAHTMILTEDGTVFACGRNDEGQLGLGDKNDRLTFTEVTLPDGKVAKQVVGGQRHTMILAEDGTVFACGWNNHVQLGLGDYDNRDTFTAVPALPDGKVASQVVAGGAYTMIIAQDGTVFTCGSNYHGQLGLGDYDNRLTFTEVTLPDDKVASQVVAGSMHTMIIAKDGTVLACGMNLRGQLGMGDYDNRDTFTVVPDLPDGKVASQVVAGGAQTMIIAKDDTVFACGENGIGQLGLGDNNNRNTFTPIRALPNEGRLQNANNE